MLNGTSGTKNRYYKCTKNRQGLIYETVIRYAWMTARKVHNICINIIVNEKHIGNVNICV